VIVLSILRQEMHSSNKTINSILRQKAADANEAHKN